MGADTDPQSTAPTVGRAGDTHRTCRRRHPAWLRCRQPIRRGHGRMRLRPWRRWCSRATRDPLARARPRSPRMRRWPTGFRRLSSKMGVCGVEDFSTSTHHLNMGRMPTAPGMLHADRVIVQCVHGLEDVSVRCSCI